MKSMRLLAAALSAALAVCLPRAAAAEDSLEFIQALENKGYADIAAEYLADMKEKNSLPPDVAEVWDMEMSKCLRKAADQAYTPAEGVKLRKQSQEHLDKFLQEKPNHPEAISAQVWWAGFISDEAMEHAWKARDPRLSATQKAEERAQARAALEKAQPRFADAAEKFRKLLAAAKNPRKKADIELQWQDARFKAILCDYYLAEAIENKADAKRVTLLKNVSKSFDEVYQVNRGTDIGTRAHAWQGKAEMELGNIELAKDIFDEVLVQVPDPREVNRDRGAMRDLELMASLYTLIQQFRFDITAGKSPAQFIEEAAAWRKAYAKIPSMVKTDGYQGISLELAKSLLAAADKAAAPTKAKLAGDAMAILTEMTRTPSGYQQEAIRLRRDRLGGSGEPGTFDEAIVEGDANAAEKKWDDAVREYEAALQFAGKLPGPALEKIKNRVKAVREAIAQIKFLLAHELFIKGKLPECLEALQAVREKYADAAAAPAASALAVTVLVNQFVNIPANDVEKKEAAMKQVIQAAQATADNWPGKPEADDARMTLGKLYLFNSDAKQALKQFDTVNPKSERYPMALHLAGHTYWQLYLIEKQRRQEGGKFDEKAMANNRDLAVNKIRESYQMQRKAAPRNGPMPQPLMETELLWAEINLEGGDGKTAAALFQPLIDAAKASHAAFDKTMQRIFLGGVRAYMAADDLDKAGKVGMTLIELGPDSDAVNRELVNFAKLLENERRKADAALTKAASGPETEAAKTRLAAMNDVLGKVLAKLASREEISAAGMVWIAETSSKVGLDDAAEKQCNLFLKRVNEDPVFKKKGGAKAVTKVRTILIAILVKREKFQQALQETEELMKAQPRALEPKLEKCRLLQAWGEKDPKRFAEALGNWDTLRRQLERYKDKLKKEFFEVVYSEAVCLYKEATRLDKSGDKAKAAERALDGQKLLKNALFYSPKLDGPDTLAKYNKLLDQFDVLQGRQPPDRKATKT